MNNIDTIIDSLINGTKNETIVWIKGTIYHVTKSSDGLTKFEIELKPKTCLWIKNENLNEGRKYVASCIKVQELSDFIKLKLYGVEDKEKAKSDENDILNSIANSIGLEQIRENKLKEILGDSVKNEPKKKWYKF